MRHISSLVCGIAIVASLSASSFGASPIRIDIAVVPKKETENNQRKGNVSKAVTQFQYAVKLTNRAFAPAAGLRAEYRIFVRDDSGKGSTSKQKLKKQSFDAKVPDIAANGNYSFTTDPVKLESSLLDANWVYSNGNRSKSADKVMGVWIRIYQGDQVVGEYVNPTTLSVKEKF